MAFKGNIFLIKVTYIDKAIQTTLFLGHGAMLLQFHANDAWRKVFTLRILNVGWSLFFKFFMKDKF